MGRKTGSASGALAGKKRRQPRQASRQLSAGLVSIPGHWLLAVGLSYAVYDLDRARRGLGGHDARPRSARRCWSAWSPAGSWTAGTGAGPWSRPTCCSHGAAAAAVRGRAAADLARLPGAGRSRRVADVLPRRPSRRCCRRVVDEVADSSRAGHRQRAQRPGHDRARLAGGGTRRRARPRRRHPAGRAGRHRAPSCWPRCSCPDPYGAVPSPTRRSTRGRTRVRGRRPGAPRRLVQGASGWRWARGRSGPGDVLARHDVRREHLGHAVRAVRAARCWTALRRLLGVDQRGAGRRRRRQRPGRRDVRGRWSPRRMLGVGALVAEPSTCVIARLPVWPAVMPGRPEC